MIKLWHIQEERIWTLLSLNGIFQILENVGSVGEGEAKNISSTSDNFTGLWEKKLIMSRTNSGERFWQAIHDLSCDAKMN